MSQIQSHRHSIDLMDESSKYTPGGVHSSLRKISIDMVFKRAHGPYIWDVDDNRYLDYNAAFAAILLGHTHEVIDRAVAEAVSQLDCTSLGTTEDEIAVSKKIVEHVPSAELALICNSGSEATYHALRLSRAYTTRMKILKFQGCYHGWHDYVLMNVHSPADKLGKKDPVSAGMLPEAVEYTTVLEINDLEALAKALRTCEFAAVILEPVLHNVGCLIPTIEFLQGMRDLCTETGTVLIFDEVITGFRHGLGGYQARIGITPDLTTLGKAMANGYPCAAIAGNRELMTLFATSGGPVYFAGTHNAHPVTTAATKATIAELEKGEAYEHMFAMGKYFRTELTAIAQRLGIPMIVTGYGSIVAPLFMDPELGLPKNYRELLCSETDIDQNFRLGLIERGVFVYPRARRRITLTAAHTKEDIDFTLQAAEDVLRELKAHHN